MIVFYGKGKVGTSFQNLCNYIGKDCILMDDADRDDTILNNADIIVPTPWISQLHDIYSNYSDKIISELDVCWHIMQEQKIAPQTIGITGTDWKSTVTWILAESLRQLLPTYHIHITGNFDDPMSKTILQIIQAWTQNENHIFVAECSSFMLYPVKEYSFTIWIRTNFATDHLNWHPNMQAYFNAKQNLFRHSKKGYTNQAVYENLDENNKVKSQIYSTNYDLSQTHFEWAHNQKNCALVFQVIKENIGEIAPDSLKSEKDIQDAISRIHPLKHRMQPVKTIDGIVRYDDGKSTSAQSLWAALESFHEPIILIAGGSDKGDSFDHLWDICKSIVAYWVFLWQTAPLFAHMFSNISIDHNIAPSMEECVHKAREEAKKRWAKVILFSPGCASFDMFKNYEDRAEQFMRQVEYIAISQSTPPPSSTT